MLDFATSTDLMSCQSFDKLIKSKDANDKFQRMLLYCNNTLITRNRYVIRNWHE